VERLAQKHMLACGEQKCEPGQPGSPQQRTGKVEAEGKPHPDPQICPLRQGTAGEGLTEKLTIH
jgi:hypothetical protein